ncbi:MAG: FtsK/SpoIIIE domain-containing protein [Oscillospiraceae bacterium]|nr:FtsK/SpoIIIE domain-containing protein [Oscillospiraceae bacterium]
MKNNEILVSAKFIGADVSEEISFLVLKDISLKALMEAIYYGVKKLKDHDATFSLLENYLKTRKELQVLYNVKGDFNIIDFTEEYEDKKIINSEEITGTIKVFDKKLDELGFITSSCVLFTTEPAVTAEGLFERTEKSYILKSDTSLEYNISTRRLNVIEPSVIDIIPPNEMPQKSKSSLIDVIMPTLLSTIGMIIARYFVMLFAPSASGMGDTMLLMSGAMAVVAFVTSFYNFNKQKNEYKKNVEEWKSNYENYINRKIQTINEWQKSDIKYLNSVYPNMTALFNNTAEINGAIFSRSQNDNDFMKISLGTSNEVKPLFEIKSEKKDNIFYDIYYKKHGDEIKILIPSKKDEQRRAKLTPDERAKEDKNKDLLTNLAYNFANKGVDPKDANEIVGFNYLRSNDDTKPPLLLDLKSCGALGVISNDAQTSKNFIRHIILELAYYHSPEDLQLVFFFDDQIEKNINALKVAIENENDPEKKEQLLWQLNKAKEEQNEAVENYKYLPHANELFNGVSQFVFDKDSSGVVFGQLHSIMNERSKSKSEDNDGGDSSSKPTQIVCVVFYDYDIKETGFSKYLPEVPKEGEPYVNANGLTFIFIQSIKDKLPKYCGNIVDLHDTNPGERKSSLRYNVLSRETLNVLSEGSDDKNKANDVDKLIEYKVFQNDYIFEEKKYDEQFKKAFKQLSAIYYTRIAENGKVPSMVTLFELYGYNAEKIQNDEIKRSMLASWENTDKNDVTRNMRVPIGKNEHGEMYLDLYEKADGPHMLVAGTTGSGKSETVITYVIGLCMKYSPMDLNLMLVDMKGGGFSDRLGNLPHCVGAVTDTAGEDEGTSAAYMLKRFLESLNAEIKRRKLLLSSLGVDNVDSYIRATRTIKKMRKIYCGFIEKDIADVEADLTKAIEGNAKLKGILEKIAQYEELQLSTNTTEQQLKLKEKEIEAIDQRGIELLKLQKQLNAKQREYTEKINSLSHLVLVVDEFTELKRFSSESSDVDFIAEITTIARVGRTLGFHIVLVSQNIEGAITDDIRVNSKARICLKVATKQASKEMIDSPAAAAPTMPLNGRAYLLVGTGTRFEYFQSAYTGANKNLNIEPPVVVTQVKNTGKYNPDFYSSKKDNAIEKKKNENVNEHDTQLAYITNTIIKMSEGMEKPRQIFLPPLPGKIADETEWEGLK